MNQARNHATVPAPPAPARPVMPAARIRVPAIAVASICWGALAFGGVYAWAYWPLAALSVAAGAIGLFTYPPGRGVISRPLAVALAAIPLAIGIQLIPLPLGWLDSISPAATRLLADTDFAFGAGLLRYHPLSIDAPSTASALALYVAFAVLMVGMARVLAMDNVKRLVEAITVLAILLAVLGIVQKPVYSGRVFGFWQPETLGNPFGPFINRNHFAGWMLMAFPLTLALLFAGLEQGMRGVKPHWRDRVLWLSSPEANRLILLATAALLMAVSMVLTMSRSGISALALSLVMAGVIVARGLNGRSRRRAVALYMVVIAAACVSWVGADSLIARFSNANWSEFNDRRGAWADAIAVARSFPAAGTGINTYETAARFYQRHTLDQFYGESHNDYLEVLAGGGALVAVPVLLCLIVIVRDVRQRMKTDPPTTSWWLRRGAITAMMAIALQESVDFSLQMPGNAVLFAVVCAIALHRSRPPQADAGQAPSPERPRLRVVASNSFVVSR